MACPFVLADAMVVKVRQDQAVRPMSLLMAGVSNAEAGERCWVLWSQRSSWRPCFPAAGSWSAADSIG